MARNAERLNAAAADLDPAGDRIVACPDDVTRQDDCTDAAAARFGELHAVINVAALYTQKGAFHDTTDEDWTLDLAVNVLGAVHVVRAVEPHMKSAGAGSVVLIGSQASMRPVAVFPQSPYGAAVGGPRPVPRRLTGVAQASYAGGMNQASTAAAHLLDAS